jgi:hypothetical protein
MQRILVTLLCLSVLGTATGCAVGRPASGVSSPARDGVGAYQTNGVSILQTIQRV